MAKSTPCLTCGQPVTWETWQKFTPCPSSKDGKSGHTVPLVLKANTGRMLRATLEHQSEHKAKVTICGKA
jgi:hypothetical protein